MASLTNSSQRNSLPNRDLASLDASVSTENAVPNIKWSTPDLQNGALNEKFVSALGRFSGLTMIRPHWTLYTTLSAMLS
jgi:hypothetical protein